MERLTQKQRAIFSGILLGTCVVSFALLVFQLYRYIDYRYQILAEAKSKIRIGSDRLVGHISDKLAAARKSVDAIAQDLSSGKVDEQEARKRLENIRRSDPSYIDAGYFTNEETNPGIQGTGWLAPYLDESLRNYVVTYAVPVKSSGALYLKLSLAWLKDEMESQSIGKRDYGMIIHQNGTILYHPVKELLLTQTNVNDMNKEAGKFSEKRRAIVEKALAGESGEGHAVTRTGRAMRYFYRPIPEAKWSLIASFIQNPAPMEGMRMRRQQIRLAIGFVIFLTTLVGFLLKPNKGGYKRMLWLISVLFAFLCGASACYTWYLAYSVPLDEYEQGKLIIDDAVSLNKFIAAANRGAKLAEKPEPFIIPVGIYIQSLEFTSSNNVAMTGYVWQRIPKSALGKIKEGFVFPEAKTLTLTPTYRIENEKDTVIGWRFEVTIRQQFDYSRYPFDRPDVSIWLDPIDLDGRAVFVPDMKAYRFMEAGSTPGLQPLIALPGYSAMGTFFSHEPRMIGSNLGLTPKLETRRSTLFYHVFLKRDFMTPLVSRFFPIFIVVSMLFIVVLSFSTDAEKQKNFGLTGFAVVGLVVSFFFTTLLGQVDLRQQIQANGLIFIENFNFVTYLMLLLSAIQAFVFAAQKKIRIIQYEHCLIPKVLYWPIFTSLLLGISLVYFY